MKIYQTILGIAGFILPCFALSAHADAAKNPLPPDYPLKTCVVSNETLGEHGKVVKVSDGGTDVYLCCNMCKKEFAKDPAKYTQKVKEAAAKQP